MWVELRLVTVATTGPEAIADTEVGCPMPSETYTSPRLLEALGLASDSQGKTATGSGFCSILGSKIEMSK